MSKHPPVRFGILMASYATMVLAGLLLRANLVAMLALLGATFVLRLLSEASIFDGGVKSWREHLVFVGGFLLLVSPAFFVGWERFSHGPIDPAGIVLLWCGVFFGVRDFFRYRAQGNRPA
jgi:hypothetical protein